MRRMARDRPIPWATAILPLGFLVALPLACAQVLGDDFSIGPGSAGSSAAGGHTSGGAGGATSSGGGGGGAGVGGVGGEPGCGPLFPGNGLACDGCMREHCCAEAIACLDEAACAACIGRHDKDTCALVGEPFFAFNQCWAEHCSGEICYPKPACNVPDTAPSNGSCFVPTVDDACNPVTGTDCGPGVQCLANSEGFYCAQYPNPAGLCLPCDNVTGVVCDAAMMCVFNTTCARFCCDDGDCGDGWCVHNVSQNPHNEVGMCVQPASFYF